MREGGAITDYHSIIAATMEVAAKRNLARVPGQRCNARLLSGCLILGNIGVETEWCSPIHTSCKDSNMCRLLHAAATYVVDSFLSIGITLHCESRFAKMQRAYLDDKGEPRDCIPVDDPEFEVALEADHDVRMMEFFFDQILTTGNIQEYNQILEDVARDSALPQMDREESLGRNKQVELFVLAACMKAGFNQVRLEEPDVHCAIGRKEYGIAVKRIKSLSQFEKRIRGAANQIKKSGLPGIIVTDMSLAFNRNNNQFTVPVSGGAFWSEWKYQADKFFSNYDPRIRCWLQPKNVRGIIMHDHISRWLPNRKWATQFLTYQFSAYKRGRKLTDFEKFSQVYLTGVRCLGVPGKGLSGG